MPKSLYTTLLLCAFVYSSQLYPLTSAFKWATTDEKRILRWMMLLHIPLTAVFGLAVYMLLLFTISKESGADGRPLGILSWFCLILAAVAARLGFSQVVHRVIGNKLDDLMKRISEALDLKIK